jgi:hypothetical protein
MDSNKPLQGPIVFADFHNADTHGRLRLNCRGTIDDLAEHGIILVEGLHLWFSDGEMITEGTVSRSQEEGIWVATVNWDAVHEVQPPGNVS